MTAKEGTCLYCMERLDGPGDYHPRCSRKFFGTPAAPRLEYGLDEMETLAGRILRAHAAIPGVQAKISLDLEASRGSGKAGRFTLVGLWGRYILKPPSKQYPAMPEVENATMRLADAGGIRTVPHALIRLKSGELAYLTKRIDRMDGAKIAMEDMCQLTGRLTEDKYKGSLEQIGKTILRYSTQPGLDAVNFFELALFCFLTGNADMHLKNFSLWRPFADEIQLSPAYDLVATKLLLPKDPEETALALNGKKKTLRRKDFDALAESLGLPAKTRENAYAQAAKTPERARKVLAAGFLPATMKKAYLDLVGSRAGRLEF
ncbi:MAG TPA: HipA domain-containing protein [Fibrobacteria bacterium]|nr:HipA domain-containing protein [Fibrobacteria bacterium]